MNNIESYIFGDIVISIEYLFFKKSNLRFILNKLNKRFESPNVLKILDYNSDTNELIIFKNEAEKIKINFFGPPSSYWVIIPNEKTRMEFGYFSYITTCKKIVNSDIIEIFFIPYPDLDDNHE